MNQNNIKPQELRATDLKIGNWVKTPAGISCITDIMEYPNGHCVRFKELGSENKYHVGYYLDVCEPIPLSEEVLLKAGFVKMDDKHNFFILGYEVNLKIDKNIKWIAWCNTVLTNVEIKHLHQLQNLFYSLVGEELEVK